MNPSSTILVVDDESLGRELLEELLSPQGYGLAFASNGAEALAQAAKLIPDLILLDVMMPGMDGYEVCRRLRADPHLAEVPVVLVTALNDRSARLKGFEAGADEFVSKPFDRAELLARVRAITKLDRYRQLLEQRTQYEAAAKWEAIGTLAAGIAHEINTPIQFIGDNTYFLRDAFGDLWRLLAAYQSSFSPSSPAKDACLAPDQVQAVASEIDLAYLEAEVPQALAQTLDGVERVASIVNAMRVFAHPVTGQKSPANLNEALQHTLTVARNEYKYVAEVALDLDPNLPLVPCDLGELNQVFLNLIVNAAHAIAARQQNDPDAQQGTITVVTRAVEDAVEVSIGDTGTGIPPQIRERIFEPFFTTKSVGKGTGQGLAIAHSIVVKKHGGHICFETEVGRGTTFAIRLPIANKEESGHG